jgi:hypothetical protein
MLVLRGMATHPVVSGASLAALAACASPTGPARDFHRRAAPGEPAALVARTRLTFDGSRFKLNGALTYPGQTAEGMLMNVRMVNSVFEDLNRPSFDPSANTTEFIDRMREYVDLGVRAFTVSFQGGDPGYEGANNSGFRANGELRSGYLGRMARVVERADALGAVVILSLYYQRQDQRLQDEQAVRAGVLNAVDWVRGKGYRNVILEIANEYGHGGFDHAVLRSDAGIAGLLRLAKDRYPALPVAASFVRSGQTTSRVAAASDLLLIHLNEAGLSDIPSLVRTLRDAYPGKPIVVNEDQRTGSAAASAATASVKAGASYGLMLVRQNQFYPFEFEGRQDDPVVYDRYVTLTQ